MRGSEAVALVSMLAAAFPGREFGAMTVQLYASVLTEFDLRDAQPAVQHLIRSSSWCPAVSDVIEACRVERSERVQDERLALVEDVIAATPVEVSELLADYWSSIEEGSLSRARARVAAEDAERGSIEERRKRALAYIDRAIEQEKRAPPPLELPGTRMDGVCPGVGQLAVKRASDGVMVCRGCGSPVDLGCGGTARTKEDRSAVGTETETPNR